ncbi:MAG: phosphate ABC transporter permease subunit PstC [Bacteroidetes bacterium GWA2_32_17]|nr:MAG: phosphate ABC transporter permease subunit PstC [Bacteroidetes bacterium GWA2_32_17]
MIKFFKSTFEKIIEGTLFLSSTITTLAIVLIIVFLFREGIGTFNQSPIEEGFSLVVNKNNPINELSAQQIKNIFDQNITNWKTVGGNKDSIILFNLDNISNFYSDSAIGENFEFLPQCISDYTEKHSGVVAFVSTRYTGKGFTGKILTTPKVTITQFISQKEWFPTAQPAAQLGVLALILGTLWVSFGAIVIALPLGLATSIYMAEVANPKVRNFLKPLVELLAGIPSVVYGFFGLVIIVPGIQKLFDLPVGETALAGSIVLGIMALPTIITISEDALRTTPKAMKEASLALGANKWQTTARVVIPYSSSGITAAAILGIGRAIGETMAVLMVTGNAAVIPHSFLEPVRTIPATIAAELGEAPQGGLHYKALFALGCILFIITMAINLIVGYVSSKKKYNTR